LTLLVWQLYNRDASRLWAELAIDAGWGASC
jgi:hypothetical protein